MRVDLFNGFKHARRNIICDNDFNWFIRIKMHHTIIQKNWNINTTTNWNACSIKQPMLLNFRNDQYSFKKNKVVISQTSI